MNTACHAYTKPHFHYTSTAELPLLKTQLSHTPSVSFHVFNFHHPPTVHKHHSTPPHTTKTCDRNPAKQAAGFTSTNPPHPQLSDACAWLAENPPLVHPELAWCGGITVPARNHQRGIACRVHASAICLQTLFLALSAFALCMHASERIANIVQLLVDCCPVWACLMWSISAVALANDQRALELH